MRMFFSSPARVLVAASIAIACGSVSVAADADLQAILAARSAEDVARDIYRNPAETLVFFDVHPGMSVVEALPGSGWYTRVLGPYIGAKGTLYGANYSVDLYKRIFGERWQKFRGRIESFPQRFPAEVAGYSDTPPNVDTFMIGQAPDALKGQFARALYIRSLHHLNRYEPHLLDDAAAEALALLKPGGIAGVVQHRAPESSSDQWASGNNGYLKQSRVIEAFTGAGFVLDASSEINSNPKDQPTESDKVWRLPPSLRVADDEARVASLAIGESDRMTLRFVKPE
jgi:predicted methyltransferase